MTRCRRTGYFDIRVRSKLTLIWVILPENVLTSYFVTIPPPSPLSEMACLRQILDILAIS